jgi:hypothetical protein
MLGDAHTRRIGGKARIERFGRALKTHLETGGRRLLFPAARE